MAHFAQLNSDDVVTNVIAVSNADTLDGNGVESEPVGIQFCRTLFGSDTRWVQTSYNGTIRKNYAGIGYQYSSARDAFIPACPGEEWSLDENTCTWKMLGPKNIDQKLSALVLPV